MERLADLLQAGRQLVVREVLRLMGDVGPVSGGVHTPATVGAPGDRTASRLGAGFEGVIKRGRSGDGTSTDS